MGLCQEAILFPTEHMLLFCWKTNAFREIFHFVFELFADIVLLYAFQILEEIKNSISLLLLFYDVRGGHSLIQFTMREHTFDRYRAYSYL